MRRLTVKEARALGCSQRWFITTRSDGVHLMRMHRASEWSDRAAPASERLGIIAMTPVQLGRVRKTLREVWQQRRVHLAPRDAGRLQALIHELLRGAAGRMRTELEWAAGVLQ